MTDGQRVEELEYYYDLMIRCTASIEANLSRVDRETAQMWYRTARCLSLLLEENKRLRSEIHTVREELYDYQRRTDSIRPYVGEERA